MIRVAKYSSGLRTKRQSKENRARGTRKGRKKKHSRLSIKMQSIAARQRKKGRKARNRKRKS